MFKKADGTYAVDIRRRGKRLAVSLHTRNRKLARERECALIDLLEKGHHDILERLRQRILPWEDIDRAYGPRGAGPDDLRTTSTVTLDDAIETAILHIGAIRRPATVNAYRIVGRHLARAFGGNSPVAAITFTRASKWFYAQQWAYNTRANFLRKAGRIWKVASQLSIDSGAAPIENIWKGVQLAAPTKEERFFLDVAATHRLLEQVAEHSVAHATWLACGYLAGLRIGEATHLRWEDVDFERNEIHIRVHTRPRPWRPKTRNSVGTVAAPTQLMELLRALPRNSPYVFGGFRRNTALKYTAEAYHFSDYTYGSARHALTYHTGRHSMISNALRAGVPVPIVAAQARATVQVILANYSHLLPSDKGDVAAIFDAPQKLRAIR